MYIIVITTTAFCRSFKNHLQLKQAFVKTETSLFVLSPLPEASFPRTIFLGQSRFVAEKICSCKFNSVAKFHCQISVTKVSELSNISNLCCV